MSGSQDSRRSRDAERKCQFCCRPDPDDVLGPWTHWPIIGGWVCGLCRTDAYEAAEFERNVTPLKADLEEVNPDV